MAVLNSLVLLLYIICFFLIAETVYWRSKQEYLKAKAKYLRELVNQTNNLEDPDQSFYSCIYENWSSKGMKISQAYSLCSLPRSSE